MSTDEAYAELQLAPGASGAEVKRAWRKLVSQWHPDRNPSATAGAKMQRLNQAYELLCANASQPHAGPAPSTAPKSAKPPHAPRRKEPPEPPPPPPQPEPTAAEPPVKTVSRKIKLSLEEASAGCIQTLRGKLISTCPHCDGLGVRILSQACPVCEGAGEVRQRVWYGFTGAPRPCEACEGDGRARQTCADCQGKGKCPPEAWQMSVRIPHGVRDGDVLHVPARAHAPGRPRVALDLSIELLPHPFFQLGADGVVRLQLPVDGIAWMAQHRLEIPTLAGLRPLDLKRDQRVYRLPGLGYPQGRRGEPGELEVQIQPQFPAQWSDLQARSLAQLINSHSGPEGNAEAPLRDWQQSLKRWQRQQSPTDA